MGRASQANQKLPQTQLGLSPQNHACPKPKKTITKLLLIGSGWVGSPI